MFDINMSLLRQNCLNRCLILRKYFQKTKQKSYKYVESQVNDYYLWKFMPSESAAVYGQRK